MSVSTLGTRREFYIHQLIRLTNANRSELDLLGTNELQSMEFNYYNEKYNWEGRSPYSPSTL